MTEPTRTAEHHAPLPEVTGPTAAGGSPPCAPFPLPAHAADDTGGHVRRHPGPNQGDRVIGHDGGVLDPDRSAAIDARRGGGSRLEANVLRRMQEAFSADFSGVRIHADGDAARLSRSVGARAFTTGADLFFGAREYDPDSPAGERLLAHELAHTLQPTPSAPLRRTLTVGRAGDPAEVEADRHADLAVRRLQTLDYGGADDARGQPAPVTAGRLVRRHTLTPRSPASLDAPMVEGAKRPWAGADYFTQEHRQRLWRFVFDRLWKSGQPRATVRKQAREVAGQAFTVVIVDHHDPQDPSYDADKRTAVGYADRHGVVHLNNSINDFYLPTGQPDVTKIRSTLVHELLHAMSFDHQGLQNFGQILSDDPRDSPDEAVTDYVAIQAYEQVYGADGESSATYQSGYFHKSKPALENETFGGAAAGVTADVANDRKNKAELGRLGGAWTGSMTPILLKVLDMSEEDLIRSYFLKPQDFAAKVTGKEAILKKQWEDAKPASQKAVGSGRTAAYQNDVNRKLDAWRDERAKSPQTDIKTLTRDQLLTEAIDHLVTTGEPRDRVTYDLALAGIRRFNPQPGQVAAAPPPEFAVLKPPTNPKAPPPPYGTSDTLGAHKALADKVTAAVGLVGLDQVGLASRAGRAARSPQVVVVGKDDTLGATFGAYPAARTQNLSADTQQRSMLEVVKMTFPDDPAAVPGAKAQDYITSRWGGGGYESRLELVIVLESDKGVISEELVHEVGHFAQDVHGLNESGVPAILLEYHNFVMHENKTPGIKRLRTYYREHDRPRRHTHTIQDVENDVSLMADQSGKNPAADALREIRAELLLAPHKEVAPEIEYNLAGEYFAKAHALNRKKLKP